MEKALYLNWELHNEELDKEERYCHNCGKKVIFTDSLKRRQNANGKNIFHYAIFKCPNDHSWNKVLNVFKATTGLTNEAEEWATKESKLDLIEVKELYYSGYNKIVININNVSKKVRMDKLLSHQIKDMSRSEVENAIKNGFILIDGEEVKSNATIKSKNIIIIELSNLKIETCNMESEKISV